MEGPAEAMDIEETMPRELQMKYFKIVATKSEQGRNVFELVNDQNDPPLKMFRNQLGRMCQKLPRAQEVASSLGPDTPDQTVLIDTVSRYQSVFVRLLVDTHKGMNFIWLRLYFEDEMTKAIVPSRRAVQLSLEDDPQRMKEFILYHTRDEIRFEELRPLIIDHVAKQ